MTPRPTSGLSALTPTQEHAIGACIAADMDAHPDTPVQLAVSARNRAQGDARSAGQAFVRAMNQLRHARREEANDPVPFPPGRGPVFEATKAANAARVALDVAERRLAEAELAVTRQEASQFAVAAE